MKLYLLDIEEKDSNSIFIYAKKLDPPYALTVITVCGIYNTHLYRKYIPNATKIKLKNFFYSDLPVDAEFYSIEATKETIKLKLGEPFVKIYYNATENFILQKSIKGPGVIEILNHVQNGPNSIHIENPDYVKFLKHDSFPPLKCITFNFDCKNEILTGFQAKITFMNEENYYEGRVGVPADIRNNPTIALNCDDINLVFKDSKSLIDHFNWVLSNTNPDVLISYNLPDFLSKKIYMKGRLCCDIYQIAINELKGRDFTIHEIAKMLKIETEEDGCQLVSNVNLLHKIFLEMKILDLSKELTEICGNLLNRSLKNFRAERVEYLFLHYCMENNILFPPKKKIEEFNYKGGLVLEPKLGFYETFILLLDFNSLYPSIIQEYNICFSTISQFNWNSNNADDEDLIIEPINQNCLGFVPRILKNIVNRRKDVKEMIGREINAHEIKKLDIRQKALKLTANSIYGCLGSNKTRFVSVEMASLITYLGRRALKSAMKIANTLNLDVIYGDTDSIMIDTHLDGANKNTEQAMKTTQQLKEQINKQYKYIEIEVDKIFKKLLILKKKKYGALVCDKKGSYLEFKGVDFLRRDYCPISCKICREVFEMLLMDTEESSTARELLGIEIPAGVSRDASKISIKDINRPFVRNNGNPKLIALILKRINDAKASIYKEPVDSFTINSALSRNLDKYVAAKSLPHISLALRLNESGHNYKKDDVISYVIGEGKGPISNRVFLKNEIFEIDYEYYISNQILPPLLRVLGGAVDFPIEKVNLILGNSKQVVHVEARNLKFQCPGCEEPVGYCKNCTKCNFEFSEGFFTNQVVESLREKGSLLYCTPSECEECHLSTFSPIEICPNCNIKLKFEARNHEFDTYIRELSDMFAESNDISSVLKHYLDSSDYSIVDLGYFMNEYKYFLANSYYD